METSRCDVQSRVRLPRIRGAAEHLDLPGPAGRAIAVRRNRADHRAVCGQLAHRDVVLLRAVRSGATHGRSGLHAGAGEALGPGPVIRAADLLSLPDVLRTV